MKETQTKAKYDVNLPETDFPMKANSAVREVDTQRFWDEHKVYEKNLAQRDKNRKFVLHDGPPYLSSAKIHIGTALNKILKDIVTKYKAQRGFYSPYVPGYDSHGLPIENAVLKDVKGGRAALTPLELRKRCKEFALSNLKGQESNFRRLGVWGNWEQPYITLDPKFESTQIRVFGTMAEKGYLYKGLKSVQWCPNCETALAEAEVEYGDHVSDAVYVRFQVAPETRSKLPAGVEKHDDVSFVIWTTTPWTLPANLGVALNPEFEYVFLKLADNSVIIIAEELRSKVLAETGIENATEIARMKGQQMELWQSRHPFVDRNSLVILGDHVTADAGTGAVHTAPGHGPEDFEIGAKYKLGVLSPVDPRGIFTEEAGQFVGQRFDKANPLIVDLLKQTGKLLDHRTYSHSYPHCWRCKKPLIFRATEQWFASVDGFRKQALEAIDKVQWLPASGRNRIFNMVENRSDWCISRQRAWGVPIPVFYCQQCKKPVITPQSIEKVADTFAKEGSDAWWEHEAEHFLGKDFTCPHCKKGQEFIKETDIMDVWFDSGVTHASVIDQRADELGGTPCEMYLEGSDQHRGWFQSSLLTSVAIHNRAPYKTVLTHGFVVDETGRKMSKSVGNVVDPADVIKEYGADVLRLWVASVNYTDDIPIGKNMLAQLAGVYRSLRNTARFLLGNLSDFDPAKDRVELSQLSSLDKFTLHRLHEVVKEVTEDFDRYEFFKYYQVLQNFCVVDLSALYLDIVKDTLYTSGKKSIERRSVQTVLYELLHALVRLLVPVTPHMAEDIWQHMPETLKGKEQSVLLTSWAEPHKDWENAEIAALFTELTQVRYVVNKALEEARAAGKIGKSLEAQVRLSIDNADLAAKLKKLGTATLPTFFITSQAVLVDGQDAANGADLLASADQNGIRVSVLKAEGTKCARCWKYTTDIGSDPKFAELCARCADALSGTCCS
jgi:isoleucyl-tRNA synthetase